MGNNIFSCCYPADKRKGRSAKAGYRELQENGINGGREVGAARASRHGATTLQSDALGRNAFRKEIERYATGTRGASRGLKGSSSEGALAREGSRVGHFNGQANNYHEHAAASCSSTTTTATTTATAVAAASSQYTTGTAPAAAAAATTTTAGSAGYRNGEKGPAARGYPAMRLGGSNNGAAAAVGVGGQSGGVTTTVGVRPMGPRIVNAHPNNQRPTDPRLGGRGGTQYPGTGGARGGGRFGVRGFSTGVGAGGRAVAARGVSQAVPAGAGTVLAKYDMKEALGVGSTSTCYRCVNRRSRKQFACKVIDKRAMDPKLKPLLAQFHVEIQVLQLLRHPNIIHMEDIFESEMKIHMVMEIMEGGELFDYVVAKGTLSESEASVMVRKVTSALAYMHSLDIIHRDLKPENLLLTNKRSDPEVKIIDFGLAKVLGEDDVGAQSFLGTRGYLAPEMLQRESYNKEVDVWALGVIVFVLLCGCLPFDDDSKKLNRAGALQKFVLRFPRWAQNLSPGAKDLLSKLLTVTPQARLSAKQALEHPWVTGQVAASDNFLESPRTLRKLSRLNSPKNGRGKGRAGGGTYGGNNPPRKSAAEVAAAAAEAHRRAEFEEQSGEYSEGGLIMGGGRPRKNSI